VTKREPCTTALGLFAESALSMNAPTLRDVRGRRTLTEVYAATGIKPPQMSLIERGLMIPTPTELAELERFYGGRVAHILVPVVIEPKEEVRDG